MPKGLKPNSGQIIISGKLTESAANTYTQDQIDLQLNVLDREVFVVTAVDLNSTAPEILTTGADVEVKSCLSTTSRTSMGDISNSNVLSALRMEGQGHAGGFYIGFQSQSLETPPAQMEYVGIIATNNFFAAVQGTNNNNPMVLDYRVYGYRAIASADTYAALTQSELLSA